MCIRDRLIRKDKEFAHDASIIQTLVNQGYITGELKKGFPAVNITNSDNFVSLLYYFGMLTIKRYVRRKDQTHHPQSGGSRTNLYLSAEHLR